MTDHIPASGTRAPRYTSYPPATQFTDAVGPKAMNAWLDKTKPGARISLYVHIPFCRRLCWFCACRTQGTRTDAPLEDYFDTLEAEIALVADKLPQDVTVSRLHLGGGTPTLLPPALLDRLFTMLDARLPRAVGAETAVEVDPTELDDARLDVLAARGMTRASLGVQDFNPAVQAAIGRPQGIDCTRSAIDGLRARGVAGINLDLLYGLPHQTVATLDATLETVLALAPDRLALYGYAHVPWVSRRQVMIDEAALPGPEARLALSRHAERRLRLSGYRAIGFDHFARPGDALSRAADAGTLHRNFQGYTVDAEDVLLGLGASAISRTPWGYAQNAARTADWVARIRGGRLSTARGHAFGGDDRLRGAVIERLLCDFAIAPERFGQSDRVREMTAQIAARWPDAVRRTPDGRLVIRPESRHLARLIAMTIDSYARPEGRHSLAI
ncbi:oxygen-independent coproporphyrinogen III oxidase [Roseobacter sp. HKCCA0434]|uniref:oxygen-independent coproporphyrinogen III oxidase n=1 Tax=Roseobacter sp. HKCCA0434 TaxID=3079297 RepID=UPI002905E0C2|nr:oxygen-independent coproporphyrinogen III oxidase [Roseobacter sp. HKCCA0434]